MVFRCLFDFFASCLTILLTLVALGVYQIKKLDESIPEDIYSKKKSAQMCNSRFNNLIEHQFISSFFLWILFENIRQILVTYKKWTARSLF